MCVIFVSVCVCVCVCMCDICVNEYFSYVSFTPSFLYSNAPLSLSLSLSLSLPIYIYLSLPLFLSFLSLSSSIFLNLSLYLSHSLFCSRLCLRSSMASLLLSASIACFFVFSWSIFCLVILTVLDNVKKSLGYPFNVGEG